MLPRHPVMKDLNLRTHLPGQNRVTRSDKLSGEAGRVLEDGSGCHRSLVATFCALQQNSSDRPRPAPAATGTPEATRPSEPGKLGAARLLGSEIRLQLRQVSRGIPLPSPHTIYWGYLSQADTHLADTHLALLSVT